MAFGVFPTDIIEYIKENNEDWLIKLRCIEDLDAVLESLMDPINQNELALLMNFSSSFIQFVEEFLILDESQDIKILFTAIKAIKLVLTPQNKYRINLKRLVNTLVTKLNDNKEVIRNEIERIIINISSYLSTKDLILQLL
jgi:hypothetical protein